MSAGFRVDLVLACFVAEWAAEVLAAREVGEGWQDKRPRCAARSVGCFDWLFSSFAHIARNTRTSRELVFCNGFSVDRTSRGNCRER